VKLTGKTHTMKRFWTSLATFSLVELIDRYPVRAGVLMLLGVGGGAGICDSSHADDSAAGIVQLQSEPKLWHGYQRAVSQLWPRLEPRKCQ
jgi:hypothetical protein